MKVLGFVATKMDYVYMKVGQTSINGTYNKKRYYNSA